MFFQVAEVAIARQMFQEILRLIAELRPQPPPAGCHCIQEQPTEGVRPNARENVRSDPRPSVRVTRGAGSGQHLASVLQEGRENANIDAGLGLIWRISDGWTKASWRISRVGRRCHAGCLPPWHSS